MPDETQTAQDTIQTTGQASATEVTPSDEQAKKFYQSYEDYANQKHSKLDKGIAERDKYLALAGHTLKEKDAEIARLTELSKGKVDTTEIAAINEVKRKDAIEKAVKAAVTDEAKQKELTAKLLKYVKKPEDIPSIIQDFMPAVETPRPAGGGGSATLTDDDLIKRGGDMSVVLTPQELKRLDEILTKRKQGG